MIVVVVPMQVSDSPFRGIMFFDRSTAIIWYKQCYYYMTIPIFYSFYFFTFFLLPSASKVSFVLHGISSSFSPPGAGAQSTNIRI